METIKTIFKEVAYNQRSIYDLIHVLINKNTDDKIEDGEKNAYQAFCCALLAKQAKSLMQKGQYIKEYNQFIQRSLLINPNCVISRLIRLMVEKRLENVRFVSHIEEDSLFLSGRVRTVCEEEIKRLINKTLAS